MAGGEVEQFLLVLLVSGDDQLDRRCVPARALLRRLLHPAVKVVGARQRNVQHLLLQPADEFDDSGGEHVKTERVGPHDALLVARRLTGAEVADPEAVAVEGDRVGVVKVARLGHQSYLEMAADPAAAQGGRFSEPTASRRTSPEVGSG
jgi:hypothetical protein